MQVWLNGRVVPLEQAHISPFDRGFLFGDGVYELVRFFDGTGMAMEAHLRRLERSLRLVRIDGFTRDDAERAMRAVLQAEGLRDAAVYLRVTRGAPPMRSHVPPTGVSPTSFAYAVETGPLDSLAAPLPIAVSVQPDERWRRCEIKSVSLMGSVLPMLAGADQGAEEAILVRDGLLSEGGSSNVLIAKGGTLVTPPVDDEPAILHGTVREVALDAARREGVSVEVRRVTEAELRAADEIMIASSRRILASVIRLDGRPFGVGGPGPVASRLLARMREDLRATLHAPAARA
ncbi:MAG: aminotransferase class IV [Planctomycetota bacterium]